MQQLENELAQTQTNLETATHNLEEKEKALQNVSFLRLCKKKNVLKFLVFLKIAWSEDVYIIPYQPFFLAQNDVVPRTVFFFLQK